MGREGKKRNGKSEKEMERRKRDRVRRGDNGR